MKVGRHLPRDVSDETVSGLFRVIEDVRDRAMFTLMVSAGLRVGEVVKLEVDGIEAIETAMVSRLQVCGKGDKDRTVWLTRETMQRVQDWLEKRPESQEKALFINRRDGGPLSVSGVQYCLKRHCQPAKVQVTCHQLRHTFARRLAERDMPLESLAKLLGHQSLKTTQLYIDGADPTVRRDFQAAMMAVEQATQSPQDLNQPAAAGHFPHSAPRMTDERPDPVAVVDELGHLGLDLPTWLKEILVEHTRRRISRWPPHRVEIQAYNHFGGLCRTGRWLVTHRQWGTLEQLQRADLVAYVNARQEEGIKPQSIATDLKRFRGLWRDLLDQETVTNGAILLVKAPVAGDHLPRYLTPTQFQRLAQLIQAETQTDRPRDRFDRAWFYLLAHAGLRASELTNLRLSDCDLHGQRLRVQAGKGDRDRVLPMTPQLVTALDQYGAVRETAPTDHLLIYKGAALKRHVVPYRLRLFGLKAQIEPLSPHRLRHTLATFLINQEMPIVSLQKFLGHQDINKTLIYARVHDETVRRQFAAAMAQIERIPVADWPIQIEQLNAPVVR
ncbi:MAG: tyrosine-type recombinase/integrase [Candidatus Brocadiales bacterium]|nr:tyrosine-type recombinase/integrase [Candidatus Bathyanammoxibius sp.]